MVDALVIDEWYELDATSTTCRPGRNPMPWTGAGQIGDSLINQRRLKSGERVFSQCGQRTPGSKSLAKKVTQKICTALRPSKPNIHEIELESNVANMRLRGFIVAKKQPVPVFSVAEADKGSAL